MFTGLVEKTGRIRRVSWGRGTVLEVAFEPWATPLEEGESVAVDGVCLTVAKRDAGRFTADVLQETLERSTLGSAAPGRIVNLERALRAGEPMGGHIVQGHVDCTGRIIEKVPRGRDFRLRIQCKRQTAAQCVLKGSVAIDGVSLTVTETGDGLLAVDVIPSTAAATTLGRKRPGDMVNIESDILGKMAGKMLGAGAAGAPGGGLTEEALLRAGFF